MGVRGAAQARRAYPDRSPRGLLVHIWSADSRPSENQLAPPACGRGC